ncbi:hypothetical protein PFICI_03156 [Pestalotiopsis fici W106-1]|uniref:Uncharacterized protein n=1 Tax=Pestalotiopsis fici (strain W106-1 / CGMCC3.15140) TaxID=1229662 RepID=W3XIS2_PESFW|nr:uncharacterized protein PFICI_03156 [Pestalotiopsis fici W106-1]ETS85131.1 hypothetical protein PFICI_03156 [Pestalotiopsis fici W106-1]
MSSRSSGVSMEVSHGREEEPKDKPDNFAEEQECEHESAKEKDKKNGGNHSIDFKTHPAFKKARVAIQLFVNRADKIERKSQNRYTMRTFAMAESDLMDVDSWHKKALTAVRKATQVDKQEGDKLKADLREKWLAGRCTFANEVGDYDMDYDYSDPDLNPNSCSDFEKDDSDLEEDGSNPEEDD